MNRFITPIALILGAFGFTAVSTAQVSNVLDGAYVKEANITKRVVPYPHLREADVMYTQRIWQEIDLREKMNHPYYYPIKPIADRKSLFDVIRNALLVEGSLVAYGTGPAGDDDEFRYPLSPNQVDSILNPTVLIPEFDLETGEKIGDRPEQVAIETGAITRYLIKEDWIWDRQRGERYVRIIGIAPRFEEFDDEALKMKILLTPIEKYTLGFETELTHSNIRNIGTSAKFSITDINAFKGAELLKMSLLGSWFNSNNGPGWEFGGDVSVASFGMRVRVIVHCF